MLHERFLGHPDGAVVMTSFDTLEEAEAKLGEEFGTCDHRAVWSKTKVTHEWFADEPFHSGLTLEVLHFGLPARWVVCEFDADRKGFTTVVFDQEGPV
jgi:hypothetical protein